MPELNPHHTLTIQKQIGPLALSVNLNFQADWTILFGPSGSGKSSILRAMAGLLGRTGIHFLRGNDRLQDTPPHLRAIRWAPQQISLFPHLTVRENLTFSADATRTPIQPATLDELIALFRLAPLLSRKPANLSGGEQQRVNLARAFAAPHCQLMLLDEPFTGMDRALRDELLPQLRTYLRDRSVPVISVTHDLDEAFQLQPEVVLLRDGQVKAQGYVTEVLAAERSRQLAALSSL